MNSGSLLASAAFTACVMNGLVRSRCSQGRRLASPHFGQRRLGSNTGWREALGDPGHGELLPAGASFHLGLQSLEGQSSPVTQAQGCSSTDALPTGWAGKK